MTIQTEMNKSNMNHVHSMIEWLAAFGKTKSGGVTRLLYSESWKQAQLSFKGVMEKAGLQTYFDSAGNLFGRLQGRDQASRTILTGSHIDTVVDGGKYDGAYGIIASFLAVQRLYQTYGTPKKTIEVVSLCEEEGSRFPITFWGSRNIQGVYSIKDVKGLRDKDGIPFVDAMKMAGFSSEAYISPIRNDIERFVELHIEQGMVLEKNENIIGVVSHIVGQRRYTINILGESNHAGTTPMEYRKDAIIHAAEFISYVTNKAKQTDPHLVATIGKVSVKPNVPNVIAGEVELSLDIRHHQKEVLDVYSKDIFDYITRFASESGITVTVSQWMDVKPVKLNEEMKKWIMEIAESKKIPYQEMVSGAGHDAQVFGSFCPTSLIFVPSKKGISHSPKEFTSIEDLEMGIEVLKEMLYKLAY